MLQDGKKQKIEDGLNMFYQMSSMAKPNNFEYLLKKWVELLKDVPVNNLEKAFNLALKHNKRYKTPSVYQVLEQAQCISNATINNPKIEMDDRYKGLTEDDYPTPEQHRLAIRNIMAVQQGRYSVEEGQQWLKDIFAGKVREKKA